MRSFSLGLRAQMALAIAVLLVGASAIALVLLENILTRQHLATRARHAEQVTRALAAHDEPARAAMVAAGAVDAVASARGTHGAPTLVAALSSSNGTYFAHENATYLRVAQPDLVAAFQVDEVRAAVANTRNALLPFGVLAVVTIAALGYAAFGLWFMRPLRAIGVATERAANGDYASQIKLQPRNELGALARSFNVMLQRIEHAKAELEQKVEQLETTQDSLVRSEKLASVGHLAAGVAHEIGNPLAALSGYNELLLDDELDDEERAEILQRTAQQLDRIRTVIRNLLDFSRDDADEPARPIDVAACVEETVALVEPTARGVRFEVGELDGPAAWAVAPQMVQVLVNLAVNAADAMDGSGRVVFGREDTDEAVRIVVDDDGPGVPEHLRAKLFEPFFTTKDPGQGTGLGLAISARLLGEVGGRIDVEPSPLGGARFVITLRRAT